MKLAPLFSVHFLLFNCFIANVYSDLQSTTNLSDEDIFLQSKYKEMDASIKRLIQEGYKTLLPHLLQASEAMNLSTSCLANILNIGLGVRNIKPWSMHFLDASGKLNDGPMTGNLQMLGNFDQCLSATAKKKNGEAAFSGYCLINYKVFLPNFQNIENPNTLLPRTHANTRNLSELLQYSIIKMHEGHSVDYYYGLCIPSGCVHKDVEKIIKYAGDMIHMNVTVDSCQVESETSYLSARKLVIICIFASFGMLGILASAMEYYSKSKIVKIKGAEILRYFSITTNFQTLINTKTDVDTLSCINGIRVLSMFYIIFEHKFSSLISITMKGNVLQNIISYFPTFFFQIVVNGYLTIDVFIFVSGFLNMYIQMKQAEKGKTLSGWKMLIHRLWRIYPGYIATILLLYLLTPRGPIAPHFTEQYIENCGREWWKNFLFINNFYPENKCLRHTWYIACDMQLFLMSLFTIPVLLKQPKIGILVNVAVIICGLLFTALWIYLKNMAPTFIYNIEVVNGKDEMLLPYMAAPSHVATYFLAILIAYFLSTKKNIKIPKVYQVIGWIAASFVYISMLFMTYRWNCGIPYTAAESALYFTFSKPLYALAVGWLIFCCITGHGGIINYILSLKLWIPLSRFTFTVYLVSQPLQLFYLANLRTALDTQWMITIWEYFGDICISCLLALVIGVLVEKPLFSLEKLIFFPMRNIQMKPKSLGNLSTANILALEEKQKGYDVESVMETPFSEKKSDDTTSPSGIVLENTMRRRSLITGIQL